MKKLFLSIAARRLNLDGRQAVFRTAVFCIVAGGMMAAGKADDLQELAALEAEADKLYTAGRYREAERYGKEMVAMGERSFRDRPEILAGCLEALGRTVREQGRYAESVPLFQRAVALAEKAHGPGHLQVAIILNNLAVAYWHQARYADAEPVLQRVLAIREKQLGANHAETAQSMANLATLDMDLCRFAEAEALFKRALPAYERALGPNHPDLASALENLANLFDREARYAEAEPLYQRSLVIREKALGRNHPDVANSLYNLGRLANDRGRYAEAEGFYQRALDVRQRILGAEHPAVAQSLNGLACALNDQGRYAEAEPLLKRAVAIDEKLLGPDHPTLAAPMANLGYVYRRQNRFDEAEALLMRCSSIVETSLGGEHLDVSRARFSLADLYIDEKKYAEAKAHFQHALRIRETVLGADHADVAWCWEGLARVHYLEGNLDEAESLIDRAIAVFDRARAAPDTRYEAYHLRASVAWRLGHQREALRDLDEALDLAEQARGLTAGAEHERASFFGRFSSSFERMVAWQTELGDAELALAAIERGRARSLLDEMNMGGAELSLGRSAAEREQFARREAAMKIQLAELERKSADADDPSLKKQMEAELAQARQHLYDYYRDQRSSSPVYRNLLSVGAGPPRLRQLQRSLLDDGGLMLVYLFGEEGGYLVAVDEKEVRSVPLVIEAEAAKTLGAGNGPLTADQLREILVNERHDGVVEQIAHPETALQASDKLAALFKALVPASERRAILSGNVKRLIVVPDGPLALVPFETLVVQAGHQPQYLLDVGPPILYAPSATVLYNLAERPETLSRSERSTVTDTAVQPVLTVANPVYGSSPSAPQSGPAAELTDLAARGRYRSAGGTLAELPYTGSESAWVAEGFKKQGMAVAALRRDLATEYNVRGNVQGRKLLHFACHGLADQAYGNFFGCLALTPGPRGAANPADDGFLTLPEIYELNLKRCDLAILSACQTNYGPQQKGEGVWAISRGFLVAGVRRVVASNWLVDDEAAASLVSAFCADLAKAEGRGGTPDYAAALHRAKRWVRKQDKWSSPYYWGTFVLVGPN